MTDEGEDRDGGSDFEKRAAENKIPPATGGDDDGGTGDQGSGNNSDQGEGAGSDKD